MPAKYLCVGSLALNDTVYADGRTSMAAPGGNALYAAVGANIWSGEVGICAVVGYDWPAGFTDQLAASAIDTRYLVEKDAETLRAWTVYEISGYRRYFSRNTEVVLLTPSPFSSTPLTAEEGAAYSEAARQVHLRNSPLPQELPTGWLDGLEAIHICPMRLESILAWIDFLEAHPHIFVSVDILPFPLSGNLDHPDLLKILRRANAFMPSEAEAESLQPGHQAEAFCRQIAARGPKLVVIKQGDHGAALFDREQDIFRQAHPYPANVDDLTGAGDSFCGGFLVGYATTRDPWRAALTGTVSASHIIEGFGGLHALSITRESAAARLHELESSQ
ncbi:MAG: PfkB family carbohydrate kinase [Anaerolineae bacterium]